MDHFRRPSPRYKDPAAARLQQHRGEAAIGQSRPMRSRPGDEAATSDGQRAEYAASLLAQYRKHVATTLEPELESLKMENADLKFDNEMAAEQVAMLTKRATEAEEELAALRRQTRAAKDDTDAQIRRAMDHAQERSNLQAKASQLEMDQVRGELRRAQELLAKAHENTYDPHMAANLSRAQHELRETTAQRDSLQSKLHALLQRFDELDGKQVGASAVLNAVTNASSELQAMVRECGDFGNGVSTAFGLMDCEAPETAAAGSQWRALSATASPSNRPPEAAGFSRLRQEADELALLAASCRSALAQEHQGLAAALKRMILRHTEVLEASASSEHLRQQEKDLARRRLAELEDDRRAERESMLTALEKERVKNRLVSVSSPLSLGEKGVAAALAVGSPTHQRKAAATHSVGAQTGPELLDMHSEQQQTARLLTEVVGLQNQLTHHRETIQLLEAQRKLFMDFVDDAAVAKHVADALHSDGMPSSEEFMVHGLLRA